MKQLVLGTAGHIDHGKTSLVKALSGIDTDRLKEEKARGITIELGFAHLDLPSGQRLGIVDVPGHEKFVKNMVAGAAGIDMVALVIAADEGVMPQTREHLDICRLLGVTRGLIVLSKIDLVDDEWLELVREDVREYVAGSFLESAPLVEVSAASGQGIEELKAALDELAGRLAEQPASGPFRLPVDRVFTMRGFGTVVTGTAIGGEVALGAELAVYPHGLTAKVRGLQVHNQEVTSARRGQRTAVNLQGVEKASLERGDVLADPGVLKPSLWLDLSVNALPEMARPLKHRAPIRLHTGTAEVMGRVLLLDRDELKPGEEAYCQVRLERPLAVMAGDRYVLRSYSPVTTIAGGTIVHPHPGRHKRRQPQVIADLAALHRGTAAERVAVIARLAGLGGIAPAELPRLVSLPPKELDKLLAEMLSARSLVRIDKESGRMLASQALQELTAAAGSLLKEFHRANPLKAGMSREEFKRRLLPRGQAKLFAHLLRVMEGEGLLKVEKDLLRLPGHRVRLADDDVRLRAYLEKAYRQGGLTPPTFKEAAAGQDQAAVREMIALLVSQGVLIKAKEGLYFHRDALTEAEAKLVAHLKEHQRIDAATFKEMTGLSRKFLIPLLEYFDSIHLTMRVGDERILRKRNSGQ